MSLYEDRLLAIYHKLGGLKRLRNFDLSGQFRLNRDRAPTGLPVVLLSDLTCVPVPMLGYYFDLFAGCIGLFHIVGGSILNRSEVCRGSYAERARFHFPKYPEGHSLVPNA